MAREHIYFELTTITDGCYSVEVPEDATWEQREAIMAREKAKWDENPLEVFEELASSYSQQADGVQLGWE